MNRLTTNGLHVSSSNNNNNKITVVMAIFSLSIPANKKEYLDFLDVLRCDTIYLLQRRDINENQYKMLDDRITEYLNKVADLK